MTEIKAGPDLDRAVAEAIGLVCTHRVLGSDMQFFSDPRDPLAGLMTFIPSTDLNYAFRAAEMAGVFSENQIVLRRDNTDETWEVAEVFPSCEIILASEDTPHLAICQAVLKIVEARRLAEESRKRVLENQ